jgi:hypothetical protein
MVRFMTASTFALRTRELNASICLRCYRTVRAESDGTLEEAQAVHSCLPHEIYTRKAPKK